MFASRCAQEARCRLAQFVLVVVRQHEEQPARGRVFSLGGGCVKRKVASHNSKGSVHKAMMFVLVVVSQHEEQLAGGSVFCCGVCVCLLLFGCRLSLWPTLQL